MISSINVTKSSEEILTEKVRFFAGQEKLGARSYRGPAVQQKEHRGERNYVYLKYIFISIFIMNLELSINFINV